MTIKAQTDSDQCVSVPGEVWPRTPEGYCSCPYCTDLREGRLEVPKTQTMWAQRMGAGR